MYMYIVDMSNTRFQVWVFLHYRYWDTYNVCLVSWHSYFAIPAPRCLQLHCGPCVCCCSTAGSTSDCRWSGGSTLSWICSPPIPPECPMTGEKSSWKHLYRYTYRCTYSYRLADYLTLLFIHVHGCSLY